MGDYVVMCKHRDGYETEYVFHARSFHDCKLQAKEHGLFGDIPLRIEQRYKHFVEREEF